MPSAGSMPMQLPRRAVRLTISLCLLLGSPALWAAANPPVCVAGTQQTFSATGALQSYAVPGNATDLYIVVDGASGGEENGTPGGHGAHLAAEVPVSGIATLNVVVGVAGGAGKGDYALAGWTKTYVNLQGTAFAPIQDTGGFPTCL